MKRPFLYIIFALLFTTILILYNQLGGFNEPVISYESVKEYTIAGKQFKGRASDPAIENLFSEMKLLKQEKGYLGPLVMVWYKEENKQDEPIEVLIGIEILPGETIPERLEPTYIQMNGVVRAEINAHASVMPSPENVLKEIRKFAETNDFMLQEIIIDKYLEESVVYTEIPVKF
jgi:hypothetical protein